MKTSYMYSDRVKHMEDIGVKVALGSAALLSLSWVACGLPCDSLLLALVAFLLEKRRL